MTEQPSLADAVRAAGERAATGNMCAAAVSLDLLNGPNRQHYDAWETTSTTGVRSSGPQTIRSMAESVSAVTGSRVTASTLGLHVRRRCCCYG